jgi:hypothetical protein
VRDTRNLDNGSLNPVFSFSGAVFLVVWYTQVIDLFSENEEIWEGTFSLIAWVMVCALPYPKILTVSCISVVFLSWLWQLQCFVWTKRKQSGVGSCKNHFMMPRSRNDFIVIPQIRPILLTIALKIEKGLAESIACSFSRL